MILAGPEILEQVKLGNIIIDPFDEKCLGPNSYDVHLGNLLIELRRKKKECWDITKPIPEHCILRYTIGDAGFILKRRTPYLAHIQEKIWCNNFVPWLDGRSTTGRYFLQCHTTAGRGDIQWGGHFTMEMMSLGHSIRIYAGLPIAQVTFFRVDGEIKPYQGRYNGQIEPTLPKPLC